MLFFVNLTEALDESDMNIVACLKDEADKAQNLSDACKVRQLRQPITVTWHIISDWTREVPRAHRGMDNMEWLIFVSSRWDLQYLNRNVGQERLSHPTYGLMKDLSPHLPLEFYTPRPLANIWARPCSPEILGGREALLSKSSDWVR